MQDPNTIQKLEAEIASLRAQLDEMIETATIRSSGAAQIRRLQQENRALKKALKRALEGQT